MRLDSPICFSSLTFTCPCPVCTRMQNLKQPLQHHVTCWGIPALVCLLPSSSRRTKKKIKHTQNNEGQRRKLQTQHLKCYCSRIFSHLVQITAQRSHGSLCFLYWQLNWGKKHIGSGVLLEAKIFDRGIRLLKLRMNELYLNSAEVAQDSVYERDSTCSFQTSLEAL